MFVNNKFKLKHIKRDGFKPSILQGIQKTSRSFRKISDQLEVALSVINMKTIIFELFLR